MSATAINATVSSAHALRRALFALAAVVLLLTAFAVGRTTVHSARRASSVTSVSVPAMTRDIDNTRCYAGRPC